MIQLLQQQRDDDEEQARILKTLRNPNEIEAYSKIFETENK